MTLGQILDQFAALPPYRRLQALRIACEDALAVWRRYRFDGVPLEYRDSIAGELHTVDDTLPARALSDVDRVLAGEPGDPAISHDYLEPLGAMHEHEDLDVPEPIKMAYYAIYRLREFAISQSSTIWDERMLMTQVGIARTARGDNLTADEGEEAQLAAAWAAEWWTRVWDLWASTPDPSYETTLDEAVWRALVANDLPAALLAQPAGLVHAVLLELAGRPEEARAMAATALGIDASAPWLIDHLIELAPGAIAVARDRRLYAVIRGTELAVRARSGGGGAYASYPEHALRLVRFTGDKLWVAGDRVDAHGAWASFFIGDPHEDQPAGRGEMRGTRALAALGPGAIVGCHASRAVLGAVASCELLGDLPVIGATIAEDGSIVVTHDGVRVSIWHRDPPSCARLVGPDGTRPRRVVLGGRDLVVTWEDGRGSVHRLR